MVHSSFWSWGKFPLTFTNITFIWIKLIDQDLTHIRPEDVGYDHQSQMFRSSRTSSRPQSGTVGGGEQVVQVDQEQTREDLLFNMLMTLQEAANTQPGDLW